MMGTMFIGKSQIDERGRMTLPKSFRDANGICSDTIAYFLPMQNSTQIKIEFVYPNKPIIKESKNGL